MTGDAAGNAVLITDGFGQFEIDTGDGDCLYDSIVAAVHRCEAAGWLPMRLRTDDWVTMSQIGDRVGRSRETVRLWSLGRLGPGGFPPPVNPGAAARFYSWAEVAPWLLYAGHPVDDSEPVLAAMNLALQLRHLAPRLTRMDAVLECLYPYRYREPDAASPVPRSRAASA